MVASQERCKSSDMDSAHLRFVILCDGGGIGWCHAGFGVNFRIPLRQSGRRVVQRPAQVLQQPQPGGGHGEPAPAGRGAVEHRPHQLEAGVLAGQPADDLDPAAGLAEGAFDDYLESSDEIRL